MNKNDSYKVLPYAEKLRGLENFIGRSAALFAYPVQYDEQLSKEEKNSDIASNMLKTGLIKRWGRGYSFNDEPKFSSYYAQHALNVHENLHGSAVDFDYERSKIKAFGECLERLALAHPNQLSTINASYNELIKLEKRALDPASCLNFSKKYLPTSVVEYKEILRSKPMSWILGKDLQTDSPVYLPYQLVYIPDMKELGNDPIIRIPISTGTACGESFEDAAYRGIMECVERDSNMIAWLTKREAAEVELKTGLFKVLRKYINNYNLGLKVWDISTDLGVPSMMAIVTDRTGVGPAVSAGTKADLNSSVAVLGAILEAFHSRNWIRSCYHFEKEPEVLAHQVLDLPTRGFYWYGKDKLKYLNFLNRNDKKVNLSDYDDSYKDDKYKKALKIIASKTTEVYGVDISLDSMLDMGVHVVRVIMPEMQPMHLDEDMPYYTGKRLTRYLGKKKINKIPAPFL